VITSPYTFVSTAEVIQYCGAQPVFADIDAETFNVRPEEIKRQLSSKTKATIPVHIAGHPCEMQSIMEIARRHNLYVVEDAAHALESEILDWELQNGKVGTRKIGTIADVTAFSFYATKNLTTGEGGMATTNDENLATKMRILSLHGLSRDAWRRYSSEGSWAYEVIEQGYKYNMSDIMAGIGIAQLKKVRKFWKIRNRYAHMYTEGFSEYPELITPVVRTNIKHAWHLYILRLKLDKLRITRNEFIEKLKGAGIGTSVHFIPLHLHPYYKKRFGCKYGDFPVAERVYESAISLPLYPRMTEEDVKYVIVNACSLVKKYRKW